jgi:hypothetical protein
MDLRARSTVALLLAGEVTLLMAAPSVEASDLTESVSIAPSTSLGSDQTVSIPKFDSSLGTLESVTVNLAGTGDFVQKFEDLGSGGQVKLTQNLQMFLGFAGQSYIPPLSTQTQVVQSEYYPTAFDGVFNFAAPSGGNSTYPVTVGGSANFNAPYILNWFTGQGVAPLYFSATGESTLIADDAELIASDLIDAGADITVTYNFQNNVSTLPEPRAWAVASLVLLGGAWLAHSRRRAPFPSRTTAR